MCRYQWLLAVQREKQERTSRCHLCCVHVSRSLISPRRILFFVFRMRCNIRDFVAARCRGSRVRVLLLPTRRLWRNTRSSGSSWFPALSLSPTTSCASSLGAKLIPGSCCKQKNRYHVLVFRNSEERVAIVPATAEWVH